MIKVAEKGPTEDITTRLKHIERSYKRGESLVGRVFQAKTYYQLNLVPSEVEYYDEYLETLPSRRFCHYMGVPLVIGEEALGVIRVINKKGPSYSVENSDFKLSESGFEEEDLTLLQTIATQVAIAIRSANFIELQQSYQELVRNSPDPIIVLDERGKVKLFNEACEILWGYSAAEVIGTHVTNYYESEREAKVIRRLLWESPDKRMQAFQTSIKDRNAEIIPISLSASLLFDKQGRSIGSIGIIRDLRETLKLQAVKTQAENWQP